MDPHRHTLTHTAIHTHTQSHTRRGSDRDSSTNTPSPKYAHTHFLKGSQTTQKGCTVATGSGLGCVCVWFLEGASNQTRTKLFIHRSADGVLSSTNGLKPPHTHPHYPPHTALLPHINSTSSPINTHSSVHHVRVSHPSPEPSTVIIFHVSGHGPCPSVKMGKMWASGEGHSRRIVAVNCLLIKQAAQFDSSGAESSAADGRWGWCVTLIILKAYLLLFHLVL